MCKRHVHVRPDETPPSEAEIEAAEGQDAEVHAEAVVESAIDDSQLTGVEVEAQADVEEIAEFDEELEADIEEDIEEPAEAVADRRQASPMS